MKDFYTNTPDVRVKFALKEKLSDGLSLCRCYVQATGKCRNGFVFTEEDILNNLDSIYYKPVVGCIHQTDDGKFYLGEHDTIIENGIERFITIPLGVVTDTPGYFEEVTEEDGTTANYLVVEVILWVGRYPELLEAIYSDEIWFNQSMEIKINAFSPYAKDKRYKHVTDWTYMALCLLGKSDDPAFNEEPCFPSARVEPFHLNDNAPNYSKEFTENFKILMNEIKSAFPQNEGKEKIIESEIKMGDTVKPAESGAEKFALSQNRVRQNLRSLIKTSDTNSYIFLGAIFPDYCYYSVETYTDDGYITRNFKQSYTIKEDDTEELVGEPVEVFIKYLTAEEQAQLDAERQSTEVFTLKNKELEDSLAQFKADKETLEKEKTDLENKVEELAKFKEDTLTEQEKVAKTAVFTKWAGRVDEKTYKAFEGESNGISAADLDTKFKLAYSDAKFAEESKTVETFSAKNDVVKIPFASHAEDSNKDLPYNGELEVFCK